MAEGDVGFWQTILQANANMIQELRRQFEQVRPETFRKVKRLQDGEEYDFDALVEAMVDMRLGLSLPDRVYWRRNKLERDVAVLFPPRHERLHRRGHRRVPRWARRVGRAQQPRRLHAVAAQPARR